MEQKKTLKILCFILLFFSAVHGFNNTLLFNNSNSINPNSSGVLEYDCVDAWIIIGGDEPGHDKADLILLMTEWVYDRVIDCGIEEDDIYYCVADINDELTSREDNITSDETISYGFREWAPTKVPMDGVLGVYLMDHGHEDGMNIAPNGAYTSIECHYDLYVFTAKTGCDRILFIYEACNSGSWYDEISHDNRIVICSTLPGFSTLGSPDSPHRALFGEGFFYSLCSGNSVGQAFIDGTDNVKAYGYWGVQFPCIDDNHDQVAHTVNQNGGLPWQNDGNDAIFLHICSNCGTQTIQLPEFHMVPLKKWFGYDPVVVTIPVSVTVGSQVGISSVAVRAVPSTWTPPLPAGDETYDNWDPAEDTYWTDLTFDAASGNYTGEIELWSPIMGDYNLTYVVEDIEGYKGKTVISQVGINSDGTAPEDTIDPTIYISNPIEGEIITQSQNIVVRGKDDNSGLQDIQLLINGDLVKTIEMPDFLPYPELTYELNPLDWVEGDMNITAIATDKAGNTASFTTIVTIPDLSTDPRIPGYSLGPIFGIIAISIILANGIIKRKIK